MIWRFFLRAAPLRARTRLDVAGRRSQTALVSYVRATVAVAVVDAVVLAIATGLLAAGIVGALLAVPLLAVLNAGIRSLLNEGNDRPLPTGQPEEPKPEKPSLDSEAT